LSVHIFYDNINYRIKRWRKTVIVIKKVIESENKSLGDLNFIITDDKSLRKINVEFLKHDYNTDVISFDYNHGNVINGEVYISLDTVRGNSVNYKVSLDNEINRVVIHGLLHLLGYDDRSDEEKDDMRKMEDKWLDYFEN
jgi:probable rRNA maturation factor